MTTRAPGETIREWEWLPNNVVGQVLNMLPLSDNIKFAAVSKHWRHVALDHRPYRMETCRNQGLPLLLISPISTQNWSYSCGLYSIANRRLLNSKLTIPYGRKNYRGSSHGWLMFEEADTSILMFNPFTGDTNRLPPITDVSGRINGGTGVPLLHKVVLLSGNPSANLSPNGFQVAAIYGTFSDLAFYGYGHNKDDFKSWTKAQSFVKKFLFTDVIYHKGLIYVTFGIKLCGVVAYDPTNKRVVGELVFPDTYTATNNIHRYLVPSSSGDLLLITKLVDKWEDTGKDVISFKVFKLSEPCPNNIEGNMGFQEMDSLGDDAIFLGDNYCSSLSLGASGFSGCQSNSIYHIHHERKLGVFNMKDGQIADQILPPWPIWILPSF